MRNKSGLVVALAVVLSAVTGAQTQTSMDVRTAERAKAVFGASEKISEVSLNAQFGYQQANPPALRALQLHLI